MSPPRTTTRPRRSGRIDDEAPVAAASTNKNKNLTAKTTTATTTTTPHGDRDRDRDRVLPSSASEEEDEEGVKLGPDVNPTRSKMDRKLYRTIVLTSNGLRCLLIHDPVAASYDEEEEEEEDDLEGDPSVEGESKRSENDADDDDDDDESDDDDDSGAGDRGAGGASGRGGGGIRDAAACVLVGAGSFHDPDHCQGLAHFLEHLLFMGSDKYPGENEYDEFVTKRGGSTNAWTEYEYTAFTLQIPQPHLFAALDRLAQFFVSPLLQTGSVDRELNSIESEFQLHKNSDSTRWQQLVASTAPPGHPASKFGWGNLRSLRDIPQLHNVNPIHQLRRFYHQHYYAANMRLVVVGGQSLDLLQEQVTNLFGPVPSLPSHRDWALADGQPSPADFVGLPVNPNNLFSWSRDDGYEYRSAVVGAGDPLVRTHEKIFRIVPVQDSHKLCLTWSIPNDAKRTDPARYYRTKPEQFVEHLLAHEASRSLYSHLRGKGWATSCVASAGDDDDFTDASSHRLFTLTFTLSRDGMENHWKDVVDASYAYLGMLKRQGQADDGGFPPWMFAELQAIAALSYHYRDEPSPDDLVEELARAMAPHHHLPFERWLDGNDLLFEYDAGAVRELLTAHLTPNHARIDLTSSLWGRASDYDNGSGAAEDGVDTMIHDLIEIEEALTFDPTSAGPPSSEPMFGTRFWCSSVPPEWIEEWTRLTESENPDYPFHLPVPNPYIPTSLGLKALPEDDSHHPLLNCSLKLRVPVGKQKQWLPATAIRYNRSKHSLLISYEDEMERWHRLDDEPFVGARDAISPGGHALEGTLDDRKIRYRVLSSHGSGLYGDETDDAVLDGVVFPPIPPALSANRLPREVYSSNLLKLWWLQDRNFHRPIADLRLKVVCAEGNKTPLHRTCADLLRLLCVDSLVEDSYMADVCELSYSMSATDIGFDISVSGFDHKLLDLFERVLTVFLSFSGQAGEIGSLPSGIDGSRFGHCKEILQRKYENSQLKSSDLCSTVRLRSFRPTIWSSHQTAVALHDLDVPLFMRTISSVFEKYSIEALYHGNVDRAGAEAAKDLLLRLLEASHGNAKPVGLPRKKQPKQRVLRIPTTPGGSTPTTWPTLVVPSKDPLDPNTSVEVYFQVGRDSVRDRALVDLLVHMMSERFFDEVRTKDQFGYDCYCDSRWSYGVIGLVFHVVTNVKSAESVLHRIDKFLAEFRSDMVKGNEKGLNGSKDDTDDDFMEHLIALATEKLDMFDSLTDETDSYWEEIRNGRYEWQAWRNEAVALWNLTKGDAIEAFDKWLGPASRRSVVAVQAIGTGAGDSSLGRPAVPPESHGSHVDEQVALFHALCKNQFV